MATENIFKVQLNTMGSETPQPLDVKTDCKDGKFYLVGDDEPIDFGEVIILPIVHRYQDTIMYNLTKFPSSEKCDYLNIYFVHLGTGNIFSTLVKKSSEGSYRRFMQKIAAFGTPADLLKTKVTFSFKEETFKAGKSKTLQFNKAGDATPEQVQAILDFFATVEQAHMISHRNVQQYALANNLDLSETMATLLPPPQKQITENGTK